MRLPLLLALVLIHPLWATAQAEAPPPTVLYTGVNLAGGEFAACKAGVMPDYGRKYIYPNVKEVEYFIGKGMNIFRIPCRWENLQNEARQPLNEGEVARLREAVQLVTSRGAVAIIDPHNYARYQGRELGEVPAEDFADFWGRVAAEFKGDPRVWFGLMNEPHGLTSPQAWVDAANAATAAIRAAGAANILLVPGNHWTSAGTWTGYGDKANSLLMLGYKDPLGHFAFEVHLYLDKDNSGTHKEVVSATVGSERARRFTEWCREHKVRGFLGEFAAPLVPDGEPAIRDLVGYMEQNRDVWLGWTWWAAGPWWGDYMFTIEPKGGADREQMAWLLPHLHGPAPLDPWLAPAAARPAAKPAAAAAAKPAGPIPVAAAKPAPALVDAKSRGAWVARLRTVVQADVAAGHGPRFQLSALRSNAIIQAFAEDGTMTLAIEGTGAMSAPWDGLRDGELAAIACDLARGDAPARQALAGFFLLLSGDADGARNRLMQAREQAAEVEQAFALR